jgi:hypothetical protein
MASSLELKNAADLSFQRNVPMAVLTVTTVSGANSSIASGSFVAINFDTSLMDNYSGHSSTTNNSRYTAQVAGWYWVRACVSFSNANATGNRGVQLYVNGTAVAYVFTIVLAGTTANFCGYEASGPVFLNVGDYVEARAFQSSGSAIGLNAAGNNMSLYWMHS